MRQVSIAVLMLFLFAHRAHAQSGNNLWQVDGRPVMQADAAIKAKVNSEEPILLFLPVGVERDTSNPMDPAVLRLNLVFKFQKLIDIRTQTKTVTLTTVLVDGKPAEYKLRAVAFDILVSVPRYEAQNTLYTPRFRMGNGEAEGSFTVIGDGTVISRGDKCYDLPEYDERNPVLTELRASTLKEEGVQDVKFCSYLFFLNRVLVFKKDSKEAVYTYDFRKHEKYERELPR